MKEGYIEIGYGVTIIYWDYIGVVLGLYKVIWGYIGIREKLGHAQHQGTGHT